MVFRNNWLVTTDRNSFRTNFQIFAKQNGIKHILLTPYHPRSNGQAERFVQTFKKRGGSIKEKLARFLFNYRNTPNSTTDQTPASLFLKRKPRTRFDLLRPDLRSKMLNLQADQKLIHDKR